MISTVFSIKALKWVDAGVVWTIILTGLAYHELGWKNGPVFVVPILALMLMARAILVPSSATRTFWLSIPVVPAVLAIQLAHGELYADTNLPFPDSSYVPILTWNMIILILAVGLATVASRVNYILRRTAYKATELGQYQIEEKIGVGAMGEVYRARHAMMRRPTAVKVIRGDLVDERTIARFELEVQQTARLTHPNTIAIYDYGRTPEGTFYYAMELLSGDDLKEIVTLTGPLPEPRVVHILAQACAALSEAHAIGLVHRDIKAGNIMLCERGRVFDVVKLMDFGLVRDTNQEDYALTAVGEVCGTPETISPEAIAGDEVGPAADLYALGAVGCYLLTGRPIFDVTTVLGFIGKHLESPPIPPSARGAIVSEDLERLLLACLEKRPEDRPESAEALRHALLALDSAGAWTQDDAARWWKSRGGELA
jgi:serine/threonine protein kinase